MVAEIFTGVGFDATLGDDESEQHAHWDPKDAFLRVELDAILLELPEGLL